MGTSTDIPSRTTTDRTRVTLVSARGRKSAYVGVDDRLHAQPIRPFALPLAPR
ncbi:hypothetical protein GCM10023336_25750 [Streptomyces similanensis]|uniref:Uncharacterized protein n=1 Tax=Streptomyces similanensis TaxID=1274988 RepID=A0ABP9KA82_9ACTN